jgi:methylated-DNA-[protein]-cysteine S-methyltransferase
MPRADAHDRSVAGALLVVGVELLERGRAGADAPWPDAVLTRSQRDLTIRARQPSHNQMSDTTRTTTTPRPLDAAVAGRQRPEPTSWERIRSALSRRADAEGLIDVAFERHDSPLGTIVIGATDAGLVRVGLPIEGEDAVLEELARRVSPRVLRAPRATITLARRELDEYFDGARRAFDAPLDWRLTAGFRRAVLHATARIPYGQTSSYRQIATRAGSPAAVRAAGTALALNPLPIIVPCHRVVRSDGRLGGYRGGPDAKAHLLELEKTR